MSIMKNLSKIAIGTVQFGIDYGISNNKGIPTQLMVNDILELALSYNITTLDTASGYGNAETIIGNSEYRDFEIVTKFLPIDIENGLLDSFNKSLVNIRRESVYGYLAHRTDSISLDVWNELIELKEKGKVKKIGYSLQSVEECERALSKEYFPDIIQVPFNFFDSRFKNLCIRLKSEGVEIHTRSTFLQGLFFLPEKALNGFFKAVRDPILTLQKTYKKELSKYLLNYCLNQDFIDKVVIGVQNKSQLEQNILGLEKIKTLKEMNIAISKEILNPALWEIETY